MVGGTMGEITIHNYSDKDVSDALVIVSFPTVGLISTIVANFLVTNLKLDRIGALISEDFYPAAIIQNGVPTPPVRIFAGEHVCGPDDECNQLVVITSELPIKTKAFSALADKILAWCKERNCKVLVTIEGINSQDPLDDKDVKIYHVASNEIAAGFHKGLKGEPLGTGMVSGLSGLLLYKGNLDDYPVSCLLAEAHSEFPDSRSAAVVLGVLDKMLPMIKMDPKPLLEQATMIEDQVRKAMSQIKPLSPTELPDAPPGMYS